MAKVEWKILSNGSFKPCPINWLANNLGVVGESKYEKAKALGLSSSSAYAISDAAVNPETEHVILRMELETLCRPSS